MSNPSRTDALRIIYAGTPEFSVPALEALIASPHEVIAVYTQPDRPAGRGRELKASPVKETALKNHIPVFQPVSLKDEAAQNELAGLNADLMVVTAYGLILPAEVLHAPRLGCINIHASLLPRWRGAAPVQRAMLAGDSKTGITIMQMDEGLDTGDMLAITETGIEAIDTSSTLHDRLMRLGAETLMQVLPSIADESVQRVKQNNDDACYADKLNKAEAKIDWNRSAVEIECVVRAYNAWPVAFTAYQKKGRSATLRIWQAMAKGELVSNKLPGTVIHESEKGLDVATGDGVLRILQLQPEGKRMMSVSDFLNAQSLLGQQLG